jgi:CDP-diacylglycerol--glycerol-3-phosphate 3-phosphatidyltransferase
VVFLFDSLWAKILALFIAGAGMELTDMFDGFVARKRKETSNFGKIMDPFADSISRFSVFLAFYAVGYADLWMIVIIFYRDAMVACIRVFSAKQNIILAARYSGKIKAIIQGVSIVLILFITIGIRLNLSYFLSMWGQNICYYLMVLVTFITAWSAVDYLLANLNVIKKAAST